MISLRAPVSHDQEFLQAVLDELRLIRQALEKPAVTVSEAPRKRTPRRKKGAQGNGVPG
jgi:hypothetical protein